MSAGERYNSVPDYFYWDSSSAMRRNRAHIRAARDSLRKAEAENKEYVDLSQGPATMQTTITKAMRQQLAGLGYSKEDIKELLPGDATDLISSGVTKGKADAAFNAREKVLDTYEEKNLKVLEIAKKRLSKLKDHHQRTKDALERQNDRHADIAESLDDSNEDEVARKLEHIEVKHLERMEKLVSSQESEIAAQSKLIQRIVDSEDGLIEELRTLNESAAATPSVEDDQILQQLLDDKAKELDAISRRQFELDKLYRKRNRFDDKVHHVLKEQRKLFNVKKFSPKKLNDLDDDLDQAQHLLDKADREVADLRSTIMRHERDLMDMQTEQRIHELENAIEDHHKPLPEFEKIVEDSKKEVEQDDPGQEVAGKIKLYRDRANEIQAFFQKIEPQFRDFITQFISTDIPSDPDIEKALRITNAGIIKRAAEMYELAGRYKRNDMYRSAILLAPTCYEVLARNMDAVLSEGEDKSSEEKEEGDEGQVVLEAQAIFDDLVSSGMIKEAISFKDMFESGKELGKKSIEVGKDLGHKAVEGVDRILFNRKDDGPRRDFGLKYQQAKENERMLHGVEIDLKQNMAMAQELLKNEEDPNRMRRIRDAIRSLEVKIKEVGEKKDIYTQFLSSPVEPGMMKGVEKQNRPKKSDYQHAVALMQETIPSFVKFFSLIPDDQKLEKEMLRQSDRISKLAQKMVKVAFKAKKKYPTLPPTIQAYGHMFIAIDDALDRALRSNEGVGK